MIEQIMANIADTSQAESLRAQLEWERVRYARLEEKLEKWQEYNARARATIESQRIAHKKESQELRETNYRLMRAVRELKKELESQ